MEVINMEYEEGTILNRLLEIENEASIERALILKVLEKIEPSKYKEALEELRKEAKK